MRLRRDISIGFLSSLWSAVLGLACVPVYIHYLGIEAYGVIGFFATAQAMLQLLDMGLSPTINREVARCAAAGSLSGAANLVHSVEFIYWGSAIVIGLSMYLTAGPIANHWLHSQQLSRATVEHSVALLGLVIACRWPTGLYQGVLLGAMKMDVASGINIGMISLANGGAIAVLALISPSIEAFFLWQAAVALLNAMVVRRAAWRTLHVSVAPRFDVAELRRIGRFALGMSGVAVSGVILTYADKLILSRLLPLADFGRYALAGAVAGGLYLLLTPTFNVIYPRMSALVAKRDERGLTDFYRTGSRLLSAVLFPMAAAAAAYSLELLTLWTRDPALAASASTITTLFLIGTALNGSMHFQHALQLASGVTRLSLIIYLILISIMVPLTIVLASHFGAIGGALAWALLNALYALIGTWLTHRSLLRGVGWAWMVSDVIIPAIISAVTIGLLSIKIRSLGLSPIATLMMGGITALACSMALLLMTHRTRSAVRSIWATASPSFDTIAESISPPRK
jgi:O-antigen/teichoic acid export membrane protein